MVLAWSQGNLNSLMQSLGNRGNKSVLLDYMESAIGNTRQEREAIKKQLRMFISDGHDTDFGMMIGLIAVN